MVLGNELDDGPAWEQAAIDNLIEERLITYDQLNFLPTAEEFLCALKICAQDESLPDQNRKPAQDAAKAVHNAIDGATGDSISCAFTMVAEMFYSGLVAKLTGKDLSETGHDFGDLDYGQVIENLSQKARSRLMEGNLMTSAPK